MDFFFEFNLPGDLELKKGIWGKVSVVSVSQEESEQSSKIREKKSWGAFVLQLC